MAYSGSTQLSSVQNPPRQISLGLAPNFNTAGNIVGSSLQTTSAFSGGTNLWYYCSSDGSTLPMGVGYFTDGLALGMRNGDAIIIVGQTSLGTSPTIALGCLMTTNSTNGFNVSVGAMIQSS